MTGKIFIVATPIGNLDDISLRATNILKKCDLIVSEDTRETLKLLNFLNIKKEQISYRDENHYKVSAKIINAVKEGLNICLVSDRGTPLISDPGYKLVRDAILEGIEIDSIPGPSVITDALVLSGFPTDKFAFLGFLPKKESQSAKILREYGSLEASLILFENPQRLDKTLRLIKDTLGNRNVAIASELTKIHQRVIRLNLLDLDEYNIGKIGEITIVVSKE
jgi:16S rRNA (cytidine1402-2'-O)-methyltransferase